jgi:class 3 adenylate cyclase
MLWVWWMLAILVVAALALHFYRKFGRRASWGRTPHMDSNTHSTHHAHHTAHSMMLAAAPQGKKEECAVVAIHVKNHPLREDANSPAGQTLERITTAAVNAGAAAYTQGTWKIFIVTPAAGHPEQAAIRLARDSERIIAEHNRQYSLKLMAGIGVNKGPMIIETSEGKPKFTSVGTTVVGAKSLAERSTGEIFVSDELHRSLLGKIKVDKVNEKTWKLRKQGSVSRNAEFLKRLYERRS